MEWESLVIVFCVTVGIAYIVLGFIMPVVIARPRSRKVRGTHRADNLTEYPYQRQLYAPNKRDEPESGVFQAHADEAIDVANSGNDKNRIRRIQP